MKKFGRTRSGKTEDRADGCVQELILLLAGICSILLILRSAPHITFSAAAVSAAVTVVCADLYLLFRVRKKMIWAGSAGILLLCAALAAGRMDLCAAQLGRACGRPYEWLCAGRNERDLPRTSGRDRAVCMLLPA